MSRIPGAEEAARLDDDAEAACRLRQLRRRLRKVEEALAAREQEVAMLRGSRSFRLTAPLRWLRAKLAGEAGTPATTSSAQADASRERHALQGLPGHVLADPGPAADPNDSHRPLRFDDALRPLLRVPVSRGELDDGQAGTATHYHGRRAAPLRLATIASRGLRDELAFDAAVTPLQAQDWRTQLAPGSHDAVLIEGTWEPEGGWGVAFVGTEASRERLQSLLAGCRALGLPVVLWARENVAELARLAWLMPQVDRVYAIDAAGLDWMRAHVPDVACGMLPPAVQPALHNPVRAYALQACRPALADKMLFDGWWDLAGALEGEAVAAAFGGRLRVVDSHWDYSRVRLDDSPRYVQLALGSVTPLEKSALLKLVAGELFLPGILAPPWRQAEAMMRAAACGAAVFWGGAEPPPWASGTPRRVEAGTVAVALDALLKDPLATSAAAHLAFREVMASHCLADRLDRIAHDLGLAAAAPRAPDRVAHLLVTMRPERLASCLQRFRADRYAQRELVVVLHGDAVDTAAARALVRPDEPVRILEAARVRSLGDCLNMAFAHTDAPYWMKLDDDDHYGPSYTEDMMLYRRAIDAPVMGKPPMFLHLEQEDRLYWDPVWASHANLFHHADEAEAALVAGGTLAGRRDVLETVRFSPARRGGSDSDFIRRCYEHGHGLLAVDGFNFVRFRSASEGFHTWKVADSALRERALAVGDAASIAGHAFI